MTLHTNRFWLILSVLLLAGTCLPAMAQKSSDFLFIEQGYTPQDSKKTYRGKSKKKSDSRIDYRGEKYGQPYYEDEYNRTRDDSNRRYNESDYNGKRDNGPRYYDTRYKNQYDDRNDSYRDAARDRRYDSRKNYSERSNSGSRRQDRYEDAPYESPSSRSRGRDDDRYYRGYYEDDYDRYAPRRSYRGEWNPVLLEPVKIDVWSARTTPKDMLIWMPRLGLDITGSGFDGDGKSYSYEKNYTYWTLESYLHYGVTERFEASMVPTLRYTPDSENNNFGFCDLPLYLRYTLYDRMDEPTFTGFARFILRTDSGEYETSFVHGYGLQLTAPLRPVMLHANLSYNFTTKRGDIKPGNYIEYGVNCEYYPYDSRMNLQLELGGKSYGDSEYNGTSLSDSGSSELHLSPGIGATFGRDTRMQFSYSRTLAGKNAGINNLLRVSLTSRFPKFSQIFY